jgi:autotransporter-associated beta strand protein
MVSITGDVNMVYGGYSSAGGGGGSNEFTITGNTVSITGDADTVYGGYGSGGEVRDLFTGNTLNKEGEASTLGDVGNFQYIDFDYETNGNANIADLNTTVVGRKFTDEQRKAMRVVLNAGGNDLTFAAGQIITGSGGIEKIGTGQLRLAGANTYSGDTKISGRRLVVTGLLGSDGSGGGNYGGTITSDTTLTFDQTANQTLGGKITGAADLVKTGAGTLTLTGENDYSGATTVSGGTLQGNITPGTALTISNEATYDGRDGTNVQQVRSVGALSGDAGTKIINTVGLSVQSGSFAGSIDETNTGGITKTGEGTLILSGTNTYGGLTTVSQGTLQGNIKEGTDLTIHVGAIYDGGGEERAIGALNDAHAIGTEVARKQHRRADQGGRRNVHLARREYLYRWHDGALALALANDGSLVKQPLTLYGGTRFENLIGSAVKYSQLIIRGTRHGSDTYGGITHVGDFDVSSGTMYFYVPKTMSRDESLLTMITARRRLIRPRRTSASTSTRRSSRWVP